MNVWRLSSWVARHKWRYTVRAFLAFTVFFTLPAAVGLVLARAFQALDDGAFGQVYGLAVLLVVIEALRMLFLHFGAIWFMQAWEFWQSLLRGNMLTAQLASGGPDAGRPVSSPGEAMARFRDDTTDIAEFVESWIDVGAGVVFTVVALVVLVTVDPLATLVLLLPMVAVALVTTILGNRLREVHRRDRLATGKVTGLLGDVMGAATTVKVNRAERLALARLALVMDRRKTTAVRAGVYRQAIRSFGQSTAEVGLGLVILIAVGSLRSGEFGVAEISLFLVYGAWLGFLPRMIGWMLARSQQAKVAYGEMRHLVADDDPANTVVQRPFAFDQIDPPFVLEDPPARRPLERLEVRHLTALYQTGGIEGASFAVERGSFTVIIGPIGAGKTTLLRAMLGLAWADEAGGDVFWNGELIEDRAAFFVPPQTAYLSQVPSLISDSLADNVLLGWGAAEDRSERLATALALAAVDRDVDMMPDGVETMIGPRGLRLSGGQRQRVATARAVVRRPELLVVDDVSSALDVETELRLWDNLAGAGTTVLAVSHRQVALDRADQVIRIEHGRLVT